MVTVHNPDRTFKLPPLDVVSRLGAGNAIRVPHAVTPLTGFWIVAMAALSAQWVVLSAAIAKDRMGNARPAPERRIPHAPTAISGIADRRP